MLTYLTDARPFKWKRYALAGLFLPCIYVLTYLSLRLTGVYHLFWNMGDWDAMDGSTRIEIVDRAFAPAAEIELRLQNRLKWVPEPSGG